MHNPFGTAEAKKAAAERIKARERAEELKRKLEEKERLMRLM